MGQLGHCGHWPLSAFCPDDLKPGFPRHSHRGRGPVGRQRWPPNQPIKWCHKPTALYSMMTDTQQNQSSSTKIFMHSCCWRPIELCIGEPRQMSQLGSSSIRNWISSDKSSTALPCSNGTKMIILVNIELHECKIMQNVQILNILFQDDIRIKLYKYY